MQSTAGATRIGPPQATWKGRLLHLRARLNTWRFDRQYDPIQRRIAARQNAAAALAVPMLLFVALCLGAAWMGFRLWKIPSWYLAARGAGSSPVSVGVAINEYRVALGPIFSVIVQAAAALLIVAGTAVAWRQFALVQRQHFADLFGRALEHLGSERIDLRINAIRELEGLLIENQDHVTRITDVLVAFIRQRAGGIPNEERQKESRQDEIEDLRQSLQSCARIGRQFKRPQPKGPYLQRDNDEFWRPLLDFSGINFSGLRLRNVQFVNAGLTNARFTEADLEIGRAHV